MRRLEVYTTPKGEAMIREEDGTTYEYVEANKDFTCRILSILDIYYPKALAGLNKWFAKSRANKSYFDFLRARQFILCNLGEFDNYIDLDIENNFNFEFVMCPTRAICPYNGHGEPANCQAICNPAFESKLSPAELRVMELYFRNIRITEEEIGEQLYISPNTVANQRKNAMRRVGVNNLSQFQVYARKTNLFK